MSSLQAFMSTAQLALLCAVHTGMCFSISSHPHSLPAMWALWAHSADELRKEKRLAHGDTESIWWGTFCPLEGQLHECRACWLPAITPGHST